MRIPCPCCGSRDIREFSYYGDATLTRPHPESSDAAQTFYDYVYVRNNPAGLHHEHWYHASGCRSWLVVTRNTLTHEISGAERAADRNPVRGSA